ncbi:DUF6527 family protein [Methylobacterium fujisawaense]|jgi:hypothetical protein
MKQHQLTPRFLEEFPATLEPGILYVSMEYAGTAHLCCCGCGHEVNLALSPRDWKLTFDGESIAMWPSVGNWGLPCKSHYIIDGNRVVWAGGWSDEQIAAGRRHDRIIKERHFGETTTPIAPAVEVEAASAPQAQSWWNRMLQWLGFKG